MDNIENRYRYINQQQENDPEYGNNPKQSYNFKANYASQPLLSMSTNFPSKPQLIRFKESLDPKSKVYAQDEPRKPDLLSKAASKPSSNNLFIQPATSSYASTNNPSTIVPSSFGSENTINKIENQRYISEYSAGLYNYVVSKENRFGMFLSRHEIDSGLRARMVDWMVEVLTSYKCIDKTFFKAVDIMDKYFMHESKSLPISKLHLVGVTSIYMATKMEEVYPIKLRTIEDKIAHKKLSQREIIEKESDMLKAMNFNILGQSIYDIASIILHKLSLSFKFLDKNITEINEILAYVCKLLVFNYSLLSHFSKQAIGVSALLVSLSVHSCLTTYLYDKIMEFANVRDPIDECKNEVIKAMRDFQSSFPSLTNLKKFTKMDHDKLVSKLSSQAY